MIASIVYNVLFAFVVLIVTAVSMLKIRFAAPIARILSAVKTVIIVVNLTVHQGVLTVAISSIVKIVRNAHIVLAVLDLWEESFAFLTNSMIEIHTSKLSRS